MAPLIFGYLALLPLYEFPDFELPRGWLDSRYHEHIGKGIQGMVAECVVLYGDEHLMERYRKELDVNPRQLKRLMIWALERSPDLRDFERLWKLHAEEKDPVS